MRDLKFHEFVNFVLQCLGSYIFDIGKEGNFVFNDALNTIYLRLYGVDKCKQEIPCNDGRQSPLN